MSLVNKLKTGWKTITFIVTALSALSFSSCKCPIPSLNNPPTATLNVAPISGQAPLETLIQLDGEDLDGKGDIIEYKIGEDKNNDGDIDDYGEVIKNSSAPIHENVIFNTSGIKKIYGQVMDSQGAIGKAGPVLINISPAPGSPTVDLSGVNTDLLEEVEKVINLPEPEDPNPEDMPVPYISATSLDGKVSIDDSLLNQNKIIVTGNLDEIGNYQINLEFGSTEGGISNTTLEGIITNLADISGQLQDNETDSPQAGIIKAYNSLDNSFLEQVQVDSSGNFDFQIDEVVSEIILQGRIMNGTTDKSYVRTIKLDGTQDHNVGAVRAVPYPSGDLSSISPIQFQTFMEEINFSGMFGLRKWNFGEFPDIVERFDGIQIIEIDPLERGEFITEEQNFIKNKVNALDDVRAFVEGRSLHVETYPSTPGSEKHYTKYANYIVPHINWIIVVPHDTLIPGGDAKIYDTYSDGYIDAVRIRLKFVENNVISHEFGHAFIASLGEAYTLSGTYTIMAPGILEKPGLADKKAAKIVYENTYKGGEGINDILGLDWLN